MGRYCAKSCCQINPFTTDSVVVGHFMNVDEQRLQSQ